MKGRLLLFVFLLAVLAVDSDASGEWSTGKYAGAFMETGVGARMLGMGGAGAAGVEDITAIFWNPAALSTLETLQFHGMHSERFAGIVNWDFIGVGLPLTDDFACGVGFFRLGVDGIPLTALKDPSLELGEIYFDAEGRRIQNDVYAYDYADDAEMAFVFSIGRKRSHRFSYGGSVKVIRKSMAEYGAWGLGFDFGVLIRPYRAMRLGVVLLDGTSTLIAWGGGRKEIITPQLKTGIAYPFRWSSFTFLPAFDLQMHLESRGSAEQVSVGQIQFAFRGGVEVTYRDRVAVRVGLDRGRFTVGSGFKISAFAVDYGFSHHLDLGGTHRVFVGLFWDKTRLASF